MTEANLDLQSSWLSYQSQKQVYCLHSSVRSVHNSRKTSCTLTWVAQDNWHCLHQLQSATRSVHNIQGKPSYTLIRLVKARLCVSAYGNSAHNSMKKKSHTPTKPDLHVFTYCDSAHSSNKNQPYTSLTYDSRPSSFHVL